MNKHLLVVLLSFASYHLWSMNDNPSKLPKKIKELCLDGGYHCNELCNIFNRPVKNVKIPPRSWLQSEKERRSQKRHHKTFTNKHYEKDRFLILRHIYYICEDLEPEETAKLMGEAIKAYDNLKN